MKGPIGAFLRIDNPCDMIKNERPALQSGETSDKILRAFYKVYNSLGYGFLEKVYENAMIIELKKEGFVVEQQVQVKVYYAGVEVGNYFVDILINNSIILELKAIEQIAENHGNQIINYLKATNLEIGFILNFGKTPEFRRKIFTNDRKSHLNN